MLAPADVPPMTAPRRCASTMASPNGVPQMTADSLSWLPPVMKMPVALPSSRDQVGVVGVLAALRPHRDHLGGAQLAEQRVVHLDDLGAERGRRRDDRDPGLLAAAGGHELVEDRALAELVLGSADDHEGSRGHDREASGCQSDAVQRADPAARRDASRQGRAGRPDRLRAGAHRARADRRRGGRCLARRRRASRPTTRWCPPRTRAHQTWEAVAGGAGWELEPELDRGLYAAGPETALDLLQTAARRRRRAGGRSATTRPWPRSPRCWTTATGTPTPSTEMAMPATRPAPSRSSSTTGPGRTSAEGTVGQAWSAFHVGRG